MKEKFIIFIMVLVVLGIIFLAYARFIDGIYVNQVLTKHDPIMQTTQQEYCTGDLVFATWSYCKAKDARATILWNLVNSIAIAYTPKDSFRKTGCYENQKLEIQRIPDYVEEGLYRFEGLIIYKTLGGEAVVKRETNEFKVKNCGGAK
jgi:hypothetical protein